MEAQDDTFEGWICVCGHYEETPYHCSYCGAEPPWGCDCSQCQDLVDEEYADDFSGEDMPSKDGL